MHRSRLLQSTLALNYNRTQNTEFIKHTCSLNSWTWEIQDKNRNKTTDTIKQLGLISITIRPNVVLIRARYTFTVSNTGNNTNGLVLYCIQVYVYHVCNCNLGNMELGFCCNSGGTNLRPTATMGDQWEIIEYCAIMHNFDTNLNLHRQSTKETPYTIAHIGVNSYWARRLCLLYTSPSPRD